MAQHGSQVHPIQTAIRVLPVGPPQPVRTRRQGMPNKNTIDLQWIIDTICNVSPCKDGRNAATPNAMGSNEKTMRRTMETMKNPGEFQRPVVTPDGRGRWRARGAAGEARVCPPGFRTSFGSGKAYARGAGSGRANVTLHLLPCATRGGSANGIQSIPAIQGFTHPELVLDRRAASPAAAAE